MPQEQHIDFAVVAPDDPLVLGAVDRLNAAGVPCFGPDAKAAILEGSKVFSKKLMKKYGIPTAAYETFDRMEDAALRYVETAKTPIVVKADGLALGKGVIIAETREEAAKAVRSMMEDRLFGESGSHIVIEEFLEGPEVSVLAFTDGKTVKPMVSSMDHKRALDGDRGLNTGGMGTVAPNPYYTKEAAQRCMDEIFLPTIRAMNAEGRTFRGCLYFGLMLTKDGPKVIEYNCRFGDPETQVVLPLLESDLLTIMQATAEGRLAETEVRFSDRSACCVVLASEGYPTHYEKGFPITLPEAAGGPRGDLHRRGEGGGRRAADERRPGPRGRGHGGLRWRTPSGTPTPWPGASPSAMPTAAATSARGPCASRIERCRTWFTVYLWRKSRRWPTMPAPSAGSCRRSWASARWRACGS